MENNPHHWPLENAAPIAQNAGLSPPVQPEIDMMLFMRKLMAQMKMSSEENSRMEAMSRKMDVKGEETNSRMEAMSRKMDKKGEETNSRMEAMSRKMDVIGDEIKREMRDAMGREMAAVRAEVRECRIGVREEMRESEARLMGEIGKITKEVED